MGHFFTRRISLNSPASLDGTVVVYGVTRIALPSVDLGLGLRAGTDSNAPLAENDPTANAFVAGPENQLVVPALERLLGEEPLDNVAELFQPLVLLGSTGTGKSHLAKAIVRHWRQVLGEVSVEYFTAADFARQLHAAREENRLAEFRLRLTELRMLVIEDLHRLPERVFVQRELRDTLDILSENNAAVVVTAQQPPAAMAELEAGLRDRLSGGLTVRLQPLGIEARRELLELTARQRGSQLRDEQLDQLAHKVEGTVAQLQRAIAEYELAEEIDCHETIDATRPPLKLKQIVAVVARYYSLTQAALCSAGRRKSLVHARSVVIHLARTLTDLSYAQIGHGLGGRDHTTIMHASRSIEKLLTNDAATQQDIEELRRILTAV